MPQELLRLEAVEEGNPLIGNLAWSSRLTCQSRKLLTHVTVHVSLKLIHRIGKQDVNVILCHLHVLCVKNTGNFEIEYISFTL